MAGISSLIFMLNIYCLFIQTDNLDTLHILVSIKNLLNNAIISV